MTDNSLTYSVEGGVSVLCFGRPDQLNSLTETVFAGIEAMLDQAESDPDLRALIIIGTGKAFCVGLDLDLLDKAFHDIAYFEAVVRRLSVIIERIEALPIPTIAAINGYARAGGFELAMACDFLLIAHDARIGDAHTDAGVVPACVSLRLMRRVGAQRAKELLWTARWLTADEAVDYGLALKSVPADHLMTEAQAFARSMTDKPRSALASLKRIFVAGADLPVAEATQLELTSFVHYMGTEPYGFEGYRAFREKRLPAWRQ